LIWTQFTEGWSEVIFFLVWLAFPAVYVPILGRHYVYKCRNELKRAHSRIESLIRELQNVTELYHDVVVDNGSRPRRPHRSGRHHLAPDDPPFNYRKGSANSEPDAPKNRRSAAPNGHLL
jgi:hypothetical protein